MKKKSKYIKVFCDTKGISYDKGYKRMSIPFIILGLAFLPSILLLLSFSEIIEMFFFLFFCWLLGFVFFYLRAKYSLGKFLTPEKLTSQTKDIGAPCGWDGTGRFLKIFGIPIDYIGPTLGILIGFYFVKLFGFPFVIPALILFGSGCSIAIGLYYWVLECRYNTKIYVYNYDKK